MDVDIIRKNGVTETTAKEAISIFVRLPAAFLDEIECTVNAETVKIHSLKCESIELDVKASNIVLDEVVGTVEINGNLDMNIGCSTLSGSVEINQIAATSKIYVPEGTPFAAITKESEPCYDIDAFGINGTSSDCHHHCNDFKE